MYMYEFIEVAILCSHCLRVLYVCCVDRVSDQYVVKRWCKRIEDGQLTVLESNGGDDHLVCSSIWKM